MKKQNRLLAITLSLILAILAGCSISQKQNSSLSKWTVSDPNIVGISLINSPDGSPRFHYKANFHSDTIDTLPFWNREYSLLGVPVVKGTINGKAYPVAFDTGNSISATVIEDIHVRENGLPLYLFDESKPGSAGMALVDEFRIGSLYASNYPCMVLENHTQIKFLGIPIGRSRHMIFPLVIMTESKYFEFDQINQTVQFSTKSSYKPDTAQWISIPFKSQDRCLLIDIEIEGIKTVLMLDTGAGYQMELQKKLVDQLFLKQPEWEAARKHKVTVFGPYSDGKQVGRRFKAKQFRLGEHVLNDVQIIYGTNSYEKMPYQGVIGFELFKDTVMCLDFEKNLLWVKKTKGSRFEDNYKSSQQNKILGTSPT